MAARGSTTTMRYTGYNHVALATADMDRTIRFWRDLLGLRLVAGLGRPGARQYFFELCPGSYVAFFEWDKVKGIPEKDHGYPVKGPFVFDHLSIAVQSGEDLWEMRDKLDAAGFWVSEPLDHGFIHSIYSFDPNGVALEFSCPVPGVDLGQNPMMLSRDPSEIALEGPDPVPCKWPEVKKPTKSQDRQVYPGEGQPLAGKAREG